MSNTPWIEKTVDLVANSENVLRIETPANVALIRNHSTAVNIYIATDTVKSTLYDAIACPGGWGSVGQPTKLKEVHLLSTENIAGVKVLLLWSDNPSAFMSQMMRASSENVGVTSTVGLKPGDLNLDESGNLNVTFSSIDLATSAKQDTIIAAVDGVEAALALAATAAKQDTIISAVDGVEAALALTATAAKQDTIISAVDGVETALALTATAAKQDTIISAVDGVEAALALAATAAKQDTIITSLGTKATSAKQDTIIAAVDGVETALGLLSTAAKQDTIINAVDGVEAALTAIDANTDPGTTITVYNVTMTNADQEYTQVLPDGTKQVLISVRDGDSTYNFRFAFVTDKVATPTAPYAKRLANCGVTLDGLNLTGKTLYFACSSAGKVMEIITIS